MAICQRKSNHSTWDVMNAGLLYQVLLLLELTEAVMAKQGLRAGAPASTTAWCLGSFSAKAAQRAALSATDLQLLGSSSAIRDQA